MRFFEVSGHCCILIYLKFSLITLSNKAPLIKCLYVILNGIRIGSIKTGQVDFSQPVYEVGMEPKMCSY